MTRAQPKELMRRRDIERRTETNYGNKPAIDRRRPSLVFTSYGSTKTGWGGGGGRGKAPGKILAFAQEMPMTRTGGGPPALPLLGLLGGREEKNRV